MRREQILESVKQKTWFGYWFFMLLFEMKLKIRFVRIREKIRGLRREEWR